MENREIYTLIEENIGKEYTEVKCGYLKYVDKYYIDKNLEKYILICKVFDNIEELISRWELYQDEDIALNMQNKVFKNDDIRWDMYFLLIYKGDEHINDIECYKIERDRFCCRKLIINAQSSIILQNDLNQKLPMTRFYSNFTGEVDVANDKYFLDLLQEEVNFDVRHILNLFKYDSEA